MNSPHGYFVESGGEVKMTKQEIIEMITAPALKPWKGIRCIIV